MYQSEHLNELFSALSKCQGEMNTVVKNCENLFFKSKYADLGAVLNACRGPMANHGLSVIQTFQQIDGIDMLVTILGHSSGQWISSRLSIRLASEKGKNELHALGSCISYLRRYALLAILSIAPEDDDGNSGVNFQAQASLPIRKSSPPVQYEPSPPVRHAFKAQSSPPISNQPVFISDKQDVELRGMIAKCGNGYSSKVVQFLGTRKINTLKQLTEADYKQLYHMTAQALIAKQAVSQEQELAEATA